MRLTAKRLTLTLLATLTVLCVVLIGANTYAENASMEMVKATINYYYYDEDAPDHIGEVAFQSFEAYMPKGSDPITESSPAIAGYAPDQTAVTVSFDESSSTNVYYKPTDVPYTIRLYKQNVLDDDYTLSEILNGTGKTGTQPTEFNGALDNRYEGFTLMYHVPDAIAADGSTVFECYYDRNYYLIDVDLGSGGYGVESKYAKYGTTLTLGTPERAGFTFTGWTVTKKVTVDDVTTEVTIDAPSLVPANGLTFIANWKANQSTTYRVVYKTRDPDGTEGSYTYSYQGVTRVSETPEKTVPLQDIIDTYSTQAPSDFTDFQYYEFDEATTMDKNVGNFTVDENGVKQVTVAGDGSTLIKLYYKPKKYTIRFVYARQAIASTELNKSTSIESGSKYLIINKKSTNASLKDSQVNSSTSRLAISNWQNGYTEWTITEVDGGYTVQNDSGQYLAIEYGTSYLTSTKTILDLTYYSDGVWTIGSNYYLNNWSGSGTSAGGWTDGYGDDGSKWYIVPSSRITVIASLGNIWASNSTGNGLYTTNSTSGTIIWSYYRLYSLPEIDKSCTLKKDSYDYDGYRLYYLALTAEYGSNIEDVWPSNVVQDTKGIDNGSTEYTFQFGSWAAEYGVAYRTASSEHSNIVGPYPTMSKELIQSSTEYLSATDSYLAETMYAWWAIPNSYVSKHEYYIYYEALQEDLENVTEAKKSTLTTNTKTTEAVTKDDGRTYVLDRTLTFTCAHNGSTRVDPFDYVGYTVTYYNKSAAKYTNSKEQSYTDSNGNTNYYTDFYYTRNVHELKFYNYNDICTPTFADSNVTSSSSIQYGASLSKYQPDLDYIPDYPSDLPEGKYAFGGWYTDDTYDTEFDWSNKTMPDSDVIAYAYWKPVTYKVNFYNDEDSYLKGKDALSTETSYYGGSLKGSAKLAEAVSNLVAPTADDQVAEQMGWFYYDSSGDLHAFDTDTMTVTDEMNLFMRWNTKKSTSYTVHYVYTDPTDGKQTQIADDTTGFSFVSLTKTFKAKTGMEAEDGMHYYPTNESTSILMSSDATKNVATFTYVKKQYAPYTVRYLDMDGNPISEEHTYSKNTSAVVTEKYVPVQGYVCTSYYQSLTLTVTGDEAVDLQNNVITFYYKKDTTNMLYRITYLVENEDGAYTCAYLEDALRFTEKNYIESVDATTADKTVTVNQYSGYTVQGYQTVDTSGNTSEATITKSGLTKIDPSASSVTVASPNTATDPSVYSREILVYYTKNTYSVKVVYRVEDTTTNSDRVEAWSNLINDNVEKLTEDSSSTKYRQYYTTVSGLKYNSNYEATAPDLSSYGFKLVENATQSIMVKTADAADVTKDTYSNTVTFTYSIVKSVMFEYTAVYPNDVSVTDGSLALSINQDSVPVDQRPEKSVTAQLEWRNYRFVGWYTDEACTDPVTDGSTLSPPILTASSTAEGALKNVLLPNKSNTDVHYYAKYDYVQGRLTVTNEYAEGTTEVDEQSFEYTVQGTSENNSWVTLTVCIVGEGSKTVVELPVGDYTVTPSGWAWRYTPDQASQTVTVEESTPKTVTFLQTLEKSKWLDGNAYEDNVFSETTSSDGDGVGGSLG